MKNCTKQQKAIIYIIAEQHKIGDIILPYSLLWMSGHNSPPSKCMMSLLIDVSTRYLDQSTKVKSLSQSLG